MQIFTEENKKKFILYFEKCKKYYFYLFAWIKYVFCMESIFENFLCLFMKSEKF